MVFHDLLSPACRPRVPQLRRHVCYVRDTPRERLGAHHMDLHSRNGSQTHCARVGRMPSPRHTPWHALHNVDHVACPPHRTPRGMPLHHASCPPHPTTTGATWHARLTPLPLVPHLLPSSSYFPLVPRVRCASYWRDNWNVLDGSIVLLSIFDLLTNAILGGVCPPLPTSLDPSPSYLP